MSFALDIAKTVGDDTRRFSLRVRLAMRTRRSVIYGPSGAGKTLLLQIMAGLLRPDSGSVRFSDEVLFDGAAGIDLPARARRFGYVFQDYALFPHLSVRQNIAFGLHGGLFNPPRGAGDAAVADALRNFELEEVAELRPSALSGGQRQRTALARALVNAPRALLLDEPFSALDPELRTRVRGEMERLLQRVAIPMVMITHDPDDLAWFGSETFHLRDGALCDTPPPAGSAPRLHAV